MRISLADDRLYEGRSSIALSAKGKTLPGPEHVEVADLLLSKAHDDLGAARVLESSEKVADHLVGFHAQQAVEKALKAVLVIQEIEIPHTHNLALLVTRLKDARLDVPDHVTQSEWLTPWAATFRYDEEPDQLDRMRAVELADEVVTWAGGQVASAR